MRKKVMRHGRKYEKLRSVEMKGFVGISIDM